jgi:hypothetical protein
MKIAAVTHVKKEVASSSDFDTLFFIWTEGFECLKTYHEL